MEYVDVTACIVTSYVIEEGLVWFRVCNATFNYVVVVSFIGGGNHRPVPSHCQALSQNVVSSTPRHERGSHSQL